MIRLFNWKKINEQYLQFLRPAWQELTRESKENLVLIPFIMLLVSFPASLAINNICLVFFLLSVILFRKKISLELEFLFNITSIIFYMDVFFLFFGLMSQRTQ